jgi:hypothetical protein
LLTEKQILGFKPAPRLAHVSYEHSERVWDRNIAQNDAMILPYDANPDRMTFSERISGCVMQRRSAARRKLSSSATATTCLTWRNYDIDTSKISIAHEYNN